MQIHFESDWSLFFFFLATFDTSLSVLCLVPVPKKINKKRKLTDGSRKLVQPIPLDSSGRPVFPIVLGGLTVYSLGEVSVALLCRRHGHSVLKVSSNSLCCLFRSSQTGCCSMTSVPSTQWASAALECLPVWKTPTSSASTPAKSRTGAQVHRYVHLYRHANTQTHTLCNLLQV